MNLKFIPLFLLLPLFFLHVYGTAEYPDSSADRSQIKEWQRLGYDDLCTYVYPRPSPTYLPPDRPYKPLWSVAAPDSPLESPWNTAFTTNLDDDSALEMVILGNRTLYAVDDTGEILWVKPHPPRSYLGFVGDADGDGRGEIFLGIKGTNQSQARLLIYNFLGNLIKRILIKGYDTGIPGHGRDGYYDGQPLVSAVKDLDGNGRPEIYVEMHASYDLYPRGLLCMDYETGETLWSFIEAVHITNVIFPDLDGDGRREILFGTSASKNGAVCPSTQTTDFVSYVFALSYNGKELWRYSVGRGFYHTMVSAYDLNGDGKMEVICYLGDKIPEERSDFGRILILSSEGKKIAEYTTPYPWIRPAGIHDMDSNGYLDAVVLADTRSDNPDHLLVVNLSSGDVMHDTLVPETEGRDVTFVPGGLNDINGDGKMEIVVSPTLRATVFVYNSELNLLWRYGGRESAGMAIISDVIPGGVNEILVTGRRITLLTLNVSVEIERMTPEDQTIYVLEGEEVNFQVEIKNTGNVTWILEVSLLQQIDDEVSYIKSKFVKTPPPGDAGTISFPWRAGGDYENLTVAIQINLTYYSGGVERIRERVSWRVNVITERALKNLITINVKSPKSVVCGEGFSVNGGYNLRAGVNGWELSKVRSLLPPARLTITFYGENYTATRKPGEFFTTTFTSPVQPGIYNLSITLIFGDVGEISESRGVKVVNRAVLERSSHTIILIPGVVAILGSVFLGRQLRRRLIPPITPLYRRDYEHPIKDHPMREKTYNLIRENPGITPAEICKRLKVKNYNTVKHHLNVLKDREQIVLKRDPVKRRVITCYPTDRNYLGWGHLSQAEKLLLDKIRSSPGIKRRGLYSDWPYSQAYLTKCLDTLQRRGAIFKTDDGGYYSNEITSTTSVEAF